MAPSSSTGGGWATRPPLDQRLSIITLAVHDLYIAGPSGEQWEIAYNPFTGVNHDGTFGQPTGP